MTNFFYGSRCEECQNIMEKIGAKTKSGMAGSINDSFILKNVGYSPPSEQFAPWLPGSHLGAHNWNEIVDNNTGKTIVTIDLWQGFILPYSKVWFEGNLPSWPRNYGGDFYNPLTDPDGSWYDEEGNLYLGIGPRF